MFLWRYFLYLSSDFLLLLGMSFSNAVLVRNVVLRVEWVWWRHHTVYLARDSFYWRKVKLLRFDGEYRIPEYWEYYKFTIWIVATLIHNGEIISAVFLTLCVTWEISCCFCCDCSNVVGIHFGRTGNQMLVTELSVPCLPLIVVKASFDVLLAVIVTTPATFRETVRRVPLKRLSTRLCGVTSQNLSFLKICVTKLKNSLWRVTVI